MAKTGFQKISYWLLMIAIFLSYWLVSRQFTGPAYLSDEIGYLTKAAAFAGHPVDFSSSWHGGYSLLLAPLFMYFSDPFVVWQGIMVLNALFWVASFMSLFYLLKRFFLERGFWAIFLAVAFCSIYPSWVIMSGYAFPTTAFVLFFLLSSIALLFYSDGKLPTLLPYSILVGYLYWIHPTGLAVAVASLLVIAVNAWHKRRLTELFLHIITVMGMIVLYKYGIHAWLSQVMTPESYNAWSHYKSIPEVLKNFANPQFWTNWAVILLGQSSYLIVTTFGILLFSVSDSYNYFRLNDTILDIDVGKTWLLFYFLLSILGILLLGSMSFAINASSSEPIRVDHWIYGRYSETVLLPLLGIGILSVWRYKTAILSSCFVLSTGFILFLFSNDTNTHAFNNLVNIQSFWPQAIFPDSNLLPWFAIGASGIVIASMLKKNFFIILVAPLFFVSISNQISWHNNILSDYSKPSSVVQFIRKNYSPGSCIGFSAQKKPEKALPERRNMYSYYLFNYDFRRMSYSKWLEICDGPYITYDEAPFLDNAKATIIAREINSDLYVGVKKAQLESLSLEGISKSGLNIDLSGKEQGIIKGCFCKNGSDLILYSNVGKIVGNSIATTGKKGYLFYGPYSKLKAGSYYLSLDIQVDEVGNSILDVVYNKGSNKIMEADLSTYIKHGSKNIKIPFRLTYDVNDIEVRLHVSENSSIKVNSYSISINEDHVLRE